jgi:fucose permease
MIDVMDKHFQDELGLTLSQSAWVQFAHWMGYFLMSLPAGWLATRLGYKGGIIAGLLLVAVGGFWFMGATSIAAFWAFLLGVCVVASGLTFLETVANPYTTVLGPPRYAATRINLAQSCNGIGWVLGPIAASLFFYGKDEMGRSTGSETLWIPYAAVGVVVLILAFVFYRAPVPDVKAEDDYRMDDNGVAAGPKERTVCRGRSYCLLLANSAALIGIFCMIFWLILDSLKVDSRGLILCVAAGLAFVVAAIVLVGVSKRISSHSIWAHDHFSGATLAQFLYVAAQAGIFSFLINYMVAEPPSLPASWLTEGSEWFEVRTKLTRADLTDLPALAQALKAKADPVSEFLMTVGKDMKGRDWSPLSKETYDLLAAYKPDAVDPKPLALALARDLNQVMKQDPNKVRPEQLLYDKQRFSGVSLSAKTQMLLADLAEQETIEPKMQEAAKEKNEGAVAALKEKLKHINRAEISRRLLHDAYPKAIAFDDSIVAVSDSFASLLTSVGFICFLIGRVTGAGILRRFAAHKAVGLYATINVAACLLVFLKLGWLSVACVFVSYFFMSIMFPTIFALGIFGLGTRAKSASAYIVMGIVGGALLPKVMGAVADHYDMSRGFIVPLVCFVGIALYGYFWPKLSGSETLHGVGSSSGH